MSDDVDVKRFIVALEKSPCSVPRANVNPNKHAPVLLRQVRVLRVRNHVNTHVRALVTRLEVYFCERFDQRSEEPGRPQAYCPTAQPGVTQ